MKRTIKIFLISLIVSTVLTAQAQPLNTNELYLFAKKSYQQFEQEHGSFIQTDNAKMHYLTWGNPNDTPLIWIHGTFSNAYEILEIAPHIIKENVYIISIDYYAHGLTELPPKEVSLYHIADDIKFLMEEKGIKKALIGGWSRGGTIATAFYDAYPSMVLGLALEDGGSVAWDEPYHKSEIVDFEIEMREYFSTYKESAIYTTEENAYISTFERFEITNKLDVKTKKRRLFTKIASLQELDNTHWQYNPLVSSLICEDSETHYLDAVHRTFQANTLFAISSHLLYPNIIYRNLNIPMMIFDPLGDDSYFDFNEGNVALKNAHPEHISLKIYEDSWHGVKHQHPDRFIKDIKELINQVE